MSARVGQPDDVADLDRQPALLDRRGKRIGDLRVDDTAIASARAETRRNEVRTRMMPPGSPRGLKPALYFFCARAVDGGTWPFSRI